jgi:hypothetical protein
MEWPGHIVFISPFLAWQVDCIARQLRGLTWTDMCIYLDVERHIYMGQYALACLRYSCIYLTFECLFARLFVTQIPDKKDMNFCSNIENWIYCYTQQQHLVGSSNICIRDKKRKLDSAFRFSRKERCNFPFIVSSKSHQQPSFSFFLFAKVPRSLTCVRSLPDVW